DFCWHQLFGAGRKAFHRLMDGFGVGLILQGGQQSLVFLVRDDCPLGAAIPLNDLNVAHRAFSLSLSYASLSVELSLRRLSHADQPRSPARSKPRYRS